ncbi:hypothetical protein Scep_013963 [Stephania cephalantha]|uniref:Uncharacterized protein n=1 Tax=Stephania cephalantha TaxID=152367 RepID=A0AAP0J2D7_9MAGN
MVASQDRRLKEILTLLRGHLPSPPTPTATSTLVRLHFRRLRHNLRCMQHPYDEEYQDNEEVVIVEESSDELEAWDCETIVSTYLNLDKHPGRKDATESRRGKKVPESVSMISSASNQKLKKKFFVPYIWLLLELVSKPKMKN